MFHGTFDDDKNKEFGLLGNSVSLTDVGQTYTKNGIVYEKVTNGLSFRYRPVLDQNLPIELINTGVISDVNGNASTMFRFRLPGNILHKGDYILINVNIAGNIGTAQQILSFTSAPTYGTPSLYKNGGVTSFQLRLEAFDSNLLLLTTTGTGFETAPASKNPGGKKDTLNGVKFALINVLNDISISLSSKYITTGGNRSHNLISVTAVYKSNYTPSIITDMSQYRKPNEHWFSDDSPWNLPLPPQAQRGTLSHPMSVSIRDKWFGKQTKSGGGQTIVHWAMVQSNSSTGPAHMFIQDVLPTDPICDWYVRPNPAGAGIHPNGPYFIRNPIASTTIGYTYKIRSPNGPIPAGQVGDKAVVLITPDKRFAIEVGGYSWNETLKRHEAGRLNVVDLYGKGFSYYNYPFSGNLTVADDLNADSYGLNMYYRAGGNPFMGGIVRRQELESGEINHMVAFMISDYIGRGGRYTIVSASGNTIVVKSAIVTALGTGFNSWQFVDYTSIFNQVGLKVRLISTPSTVGGTVYTCSGNASYDNTTGYTTFTVNETISTYSGSTLIIGGTSLENFEFSYNWPMVSRDASGRGGGYWGIIPMGQVFTFESTLDINSMGLLYPESRIVATAIKKYGAMVMDVAGNTTGIPQADQFWTEAQRSRAIADAPIIISKLVPVLNYDRTLYNQAIADTTISKPKPILPLYL